MRYSDALRKILLRNPNYKIIFNDKINSHQMMIFHREPRPATPSPLIRMTEDEWQKCGDVVNAKLADVTVRCRPGLSGDKPVLECYVRLERPVKSDIEIDIIAYSEKQAEGDRFLFGNGSVPADFASPGDIYPFTVTISQSPQSIKGFIAEARLRTP